MNFWQILGISPTTDTAAIRHAYAEKTRACHPEEDPEGFDALHTAFSEAMQYARRARRAAPAAPHGARPGPKAAPAAPAVTGTRESCLAAERAAYLEWMQTHSTPAPQAAGEGEFDFSAAETGVRRAPARPKEPADGEEEPEPPAAARPPAAPGEQFDFDHLPEQVSRQRSQRARALLEELRAACAPGADRWQAKDLLEGEAFRALQHAPEFLEPLAQMLQQEPACLEKLAVDLAYAYGLKRSDEAPDAAHEALFALLRPLWQAHWQKAQEQNTRENARPGNIAALCVGTIAVVVLLAVWDGLHIALRLPLALLGGAAGVVATLLVQRLQARGWLPATRVLALRAVQLFFLLIFFFTTGPRSAAGLLACFVAAALPGRKWYFRLSRRERFSLTAACGVLALLWLPFSLFLMPPITDDVAFGTIFGWCVLPLAFLRCVVSNCRFYKLAARYGL